MTLPLPKEKCEYCQQLAGTQCVDCGTPYVMIPLEGVMHLEMLLTTAATSNTYTPAMRAYFKGLKESVHIQSLRLY